MARIALAVGLAVAGAVTGGLAWAGYLGFGIAGSELGAIALGASVGLGVGDARGGLLVKQILKREEHADEIEFPKLEHANWFPVEGVAAYIDRLSDGTMHLYDYASKKESEGPKVIFTRAAVGNALPTLLGMGLCCQPAIPEQSIPRSNCGVITESWIDGDKLMIRGGVYGIQFPEVIAELEKGQLQLSPSFHDTLFDHSKLPEQISILHTTFTSVSILHPWATAFDGTKIWLTKRSYVAMTDTEDFENQRKQRAALIDAA